MTGNDRVTEEMVERAAKAMFDSFGPLLDYTGEEFTFDEFQRTGGLITDEETYTLTFDHLVTLARAALTAALGDVEPDTFGFRQKRIDYLEGRLREAGIIEELRKQIAAAGDVESLDALLNSVHRNCEIKSVNRWANGDWGCVLGIRGKVLPEATGATRMAAIHAAVANAKGGE